MAHGRRMLRGVMKAKNEAAKLLQQFSGTLRFGKRRLHLRASLTERPPKRKNNFSLYLKMIGGIEMKMSVCKSYGDLPLFLNAKLVAQVLGVSISTAYEVMHEPGFPTLRVGSRMVVPKEKFIRWAEEQSGGAK